MAQDEIDSLPEKQRLFAAEYPVDFNATQAAIRAGYSSKTAAVKGCQLLKIPKIKEIVDEATEARMLALGITSQGVLEEIAKLAFSNMLDYIKITSNGLAEIDLTELDPGKAAAITDLTIESHKVPGQPGEVQKVKFKLADKGVNLERLGKYLKLFTDRQEIESSFNVTIGDKDAAGL